MFSLNPPLAEQKRIVTKIKTLLNICNKIEQNIEQKEASRDVLLKAIVKKD